MKRFAKLEVDEKKLSSNEAVLSFPCKDCERTILSIGIPEYDLTIQHFPVHLAFSSLDVDLTSIEDTGENLTQMAFQITCECGNSYLFPIGTDGGIVVSPDELERQVSSVPRRVQSRIERPLEHWNVGQ